MPSMLDILKDPKKIRARIRSDAAAAAQTT